jgi:hypothetical protein
MELPLEPGHGHFAIGGGGSLAATGPRWSPQGDRIVFYSSNADRIADVWMLDARGAPERVTPTIDNYCMSGGARMAGRSAKREELSEESGATTLRSWPGPSPFALGPALRPSPDASPSRFALRRWTGYAT